MNLEVMNNKVGIYKNCKRVLGHYGLPTEYLKSVIDRHYSNKNWISETLEINEQTGYRLVFNLANTMDSRPLAVQLLQEIEGLSEGKYKMLDLQFMWKQKNKIRVTKIIQEMWSDLHNRACSVYREDLLTTPFAQCCIEATKFHPLSMLSEDEWTEGYIHRFHVWYGDYVKNGRVAVLSLNPFDFITASDGNREYCGFTSCVRPDGEYANTILDYFASNCVAIMYTAKPENLNFKEGRCWVYMAPDAVFQGRVYGSMFDSDLLLVRDYIQQKLLPDDNGSLFGEGNSTDAKWTKRSGKLTLQGNDCTTDGNGYLDYGYGIMSIVKGTDQKTFFEFNEGICLSCGGGTEGQESGYACSDCAGTGYGCIGCSESLREDDCFYVNGNGPYCESCFEDVASWCSCCDETYFRNRMIEVENGNDVCEGCFSETGFTCHQCEKNFIHTVPSYSSRKAEDVTTDINGDEYCSACAEECLCICDECSDRIHHDDAHNTQDDMYLCDGCFINSTYKSFDNKIFHSEDERDRYDEENSDDNGQEHGEKVAACG